MLDSAGVQLRDTDGRLRYRGLGAQCPGLRSKKRHGQWWFALELSPGPHGRRRIVEGGFGSRTEAAAALAAVITRLQVREDLRCTVEEVLWRWLRVARVPLATTTADLVEGHIRSYLLPHLGTIPVQELRARDITQMFEAIEVRNKEIRCAQATLAAAREAQRQWRAQYGRGRGRPRRDAAASPVPEPLLPSFPDHPQLRLAGPATQQRIRQSLRSALTHAVKHGMIPEEMAALADVPHGRGRTALSPDVLTPAGWSVGAQ
ncbi:hypothetical protein [Kitasatospora phosalacinea]|uniref:hypothetical protein n=1 Tax=Kitasatospora phosalacinea TaxID=2065 RepID=UPI0005265195|nr:hypothetical protein [Kitasatospora phosalacinea]